MQYVSRTHHYIGNRRQENNGLWRIGVPGQVSRPFITAADTAAELVLTTGTGRTHASELANRQNPTNIDGGVNPTNIDGGTADVSSMCTTATGRAVSFKLSGPSSPSLATNANPDHGLRQRGEQEVAMG